ncbi:MAG: hypothetical protein ACRCXT_03325 [Paraclostridium sp.]
MVNIIEIQSKIKEYFKKQKIDELNQVMESEDCIRKVNMLNDLKYDLNRLSDNLIDFTKVTDEIIINILTKEVESKS